VLVAAGTLPWPGRARGALATCGAARDTRARHRSEERRRGCAGLQRGDTGRGWTAAAGPRSRPFGPHMGLWLVVLATTVAPPRDGGDGSLVLGMVTTVAGLLQHGGGLYVPNLGPAGPYWDWCASAGASRAFGPGRT
jgi:hypothetical protein